MQNYEEIELMITGQPTEEVVIEALANSLNLNTKDVSIVEDPTFPTTFSTLEEKHCQA